MMKYLETQLGTLHHGAALHELRAMAPGSVDMVVTSPPYWGLRNYKVEHQLGLEKNYKDYIERLCRIFDEVWRVLKDTGTCWVNIGDTYWNPAGSCNNPGGNAGSIESKKKKRSAFPLHRGNTTDCPDLPQKSLVGIPDRFKIAMIDRGWICRNQVIWHKPNCMPSSVPNRLTVDHEVLFFFAKSNRTQYWIHQRESHLITKKPKADCIWIDLLDGVEYNQKPEAYTDEKIICPSCNGTGYFTGWFGKTKCESCNGVKKIRRWQRKNLWEGRDYYYEQQFEPYSENSDVEYRYQLENAKPPGEKNRIGANGPYKQNGERPKQNPNGRNKRTVWTIPTEGYNGAHFAVFPKALIDTPIRAGCPREVCVKCGAPRENILEVVGKKQTPPFGGHKHQDNGNPTYSGNTTQQIKQIAGLTDCGCGAAFAPGVVLDPFLGSGTTAEYCEENNLSWVGIELSGEYCELINERLERWQGQQRLFLAEVPT